MIANIDENVFIPILFHNCNFILIEILLKNFSFFFFLNRSKKVKLKK